MLPRPFRIRYSYKGARRRYLPDFLVVLADQSKVLVEIKPYKLLKDPLVQRKAQAGHRAAAKKGYTYVVITERDLWSGKVQRLRLFERSEKLRQAPATAG